MEKFKKYAMKFCNIFIVLLIIFDLLQIVFTGVNIFIVTSFIYPVIYFLCWLFKEQKNIKHKLFYPCAVICIMIFAFSFPPVLSSESLWKYPFQKALINNYQNIDVPEWFPDFADDVESDYSFNYCPSMMQGTGHCTVEFITDTQTAHKYAEDFKDKAKCSFPLKDYCNNYNDSYPISENENVYIFFNKTFWGENPSKNARVYVLDYIPDFNHPHSSAVIIDETSGRVSFAQLG